MSIITYGLDPIDSKVITEGYGPVEVQVIIEEVYLPSGGRTFRPKKKKITIKFKTPEEESYQFVEFLEDEDEDIFDINDTMSVLFKYVKNEEDLKIFILNGIKQKTNGFKFIIKDGEIDEN